METCYLCPAPKQSITNGLNCCGVHMRILNEYENSADKNGNSEMREIIERIGLRDILSDPDRMIYALRFLQMAYGKKNLDLSQEIFFEERKVIVPFVLKASEKQFRSEIEELVVGNVVDDVIKYIGSACFRTMNIPSENL